MVPPNFVSHASLWNGTQASWVDLHPAGATNSVITAISGGQQGGTVRVANVQHASMWSGTSASWIDLHPVGMNSSVLNAISDTQQAGSVQRPDFRWHAAVWSGTANSWIDLHPASAPPDSSSRVSP